jgi:hypothetical protein
MVVQALDQLQFLNATPEREPFDGDPERFRLGVEAARPSVAVCKILDQEFWHQCWFSSDMVSARSPNRRNIRYPLEVWVIEATKKNRKTRRVESAG